MPTAAHFIYIPAVLLIGIVIGWILGSRAAADAYAAQLRRAKDGSQRPAASADASPDEPRRSTRTGGTR
jgi:hypothetical protein